MLLFHLTTQAAWKTAEAAGVYRAASLEREGFIHLSSGEQWPRTARRFFIGQSGVLLLSIDASRLTAAVRFEQADGELFPHLFGALNLDAVFRVDALDLDGQGVSRLKV